jgi:LmbE family N-acetylglucosaminyl deacetylase
VTPTIDLSLAGPSESDWGPLCDALKPFRWPVCRRLIVASPHPDDETLGCGGLLAAAVDRGLDVHVLAVTDGEAASADPDLAAIRTDELISALACIDPLGRIRYTRLGYPDGRVARSTDALAAEIGRWIEPDDLVACPLPDDGHPDHDAVSAAATAAACRRGATVRWYPVWAWHCHEPAQSRLAQGERLPLAEDVLDRKRAAVRCYASQIDGEVPIVPAEMLTRLLRPFEVLVGPA